MIPTEVPTSVMVERQKACYSFEPLGGWQLRPTDEGSADIPKKVFEGRASAKGAAELLCGSAAFFKDLIPSREGRRLTNEWIKMLNNW